jgi:large subunit ribosomal protein L4
MESGGSSMSEKLVLKTWSEELLRTSSAVRTGDVELSSGVFSQPCRESILHQVVVWQLAKSRQGTRKVKTKAEVNQSKSKPWKQKGTGRARAGSRTSPLWVGGGVSHGPTPFTYTGKVQRKVRQAALKGALTQKALHERVVLIDSFESLEGKTREVCNMLKVTGLVNQSVLIVAGENIELVRRAAKNIPKVNVLPVGGVNVYDLLRSKFLVMDKQGLKEVEQRLLG